MSNLPEPILIDIFNYFDAAELRILVNVCQSWSSIIRSSNFLARQSALSVETRRKQQITTVNETIFDSTFNLHFAGLPDEVAMQDIVSAHGDTIEHVTLEKVVKIREVELVSRLRLIENVQSLTLASGYVASGECSEKFEWRQLRYLKIKDFNCEIEKYFGEARLVKLKLVALKPPSLRITDAFWSRQSQTLEELRILNCFIPFSSIRTVIDVGLLKKLQLNIKYITMNLNELLESLSTYKFAKITFKGLWSHSPTIQGIIANNPTVTRLRIINSSFDGKDELVPHINKTLPHLTYLRLPHNYGIIPFESRIHFEHLRHLEFEAIKYPMQVQRMVHVIQKSPNVKVLKVLWIGNHTVSDELFVRVIRNAPSVEHLHFGSKFDSFELSDEAIAIIGANCGEHLRLLTTFTSDVEGMRERMKRLHERNVQCIALDKNHVAKETDDDRFSKFLATNENQSYGRFIATCTWTR